MTFHLLTMPGSPANLVYIQEREVQVADIETSWSHTRVSRRRGDKPWELWSEITGAPPRNQVVGLDLTEAAELANDLGCEIPTLAEWRRAVDQIPDAQDMDFVGGVWELCSDGAEQSAVTIVGGCWHDHDADVQAAGIKTVESTTGPARFGTIGFRLCKRFSVPSEALAAMPPDATSSVP
jgi:formylglycine-generating enzyme required for sulfatase activity